MSSAGCSKCVLVTFNIIFFLIGLVPFIIGIIALASPQTLNSIISNIPGSQEIPNVINLAELIKSAAIYILVLGGAIALIGFIGCCGAWCSVKWLLGLYITLIVVFILAEIGIIVLAIFFPDIIDSTGKQLMYLTLKTFQYDIKINYTSNSITIPSDAVSASWHLLQFQAGCCGVYNWSDYSNSDISWDRKELGVPVSCCELNNTSTPSSMTDFKKPAMCPGLSNTFYRSSNINQETCFIVIKGLIDKSRYIVIGVFGGIILLEVILIIMAACICSSAKDAKSV